MSKKTTRVCKVCGQEKSLLDGTFGPTQKQVACKGACLKEYTRQAALRKAERDGARVDFSTGRVEQVEEVVEVYVEEPAPEDWVMPEATYHRNLVSAFFNMKEVYPVA